MDLPPSPPVARRSVPSTNAASTPPALPGNILDQQLQQQIASMKQQHQLQQEMLLHQFHQQQQQLAQEHEKQLQEHIKSYLEQQKKLEQQQRKEKEIMEKKRLEKIKNKNKDEESAIASSEVKQKLQEFVLTKKQREAAASNMTNSPPQFRHWVGHPGSVEQNSPPQSGLSPPYGPSSLIGKYEDDFPLRKTASEPNILKVRSALKQKVMERRITQSPMLRRKDKGTIPLKRKSPLSNSSICNSNPDSGPNSPPGGATGTLPNGSLTSLQSKELYKTSLAQQGTDFSLYTSPSMPNISLGRPPTSTGSSSNSSPSSGMTEADLRAMNAARYNLPLTSHILPNALPYYPSRQVIDGDFSQNQTAYLSGAQMKSFEENCTGKLPSPLVSPYSIPSAVSPGISEAQAAHVRLRHRPLGRTQSAPLPLQHPLLQQQQQSIFLQQQQQQQQQQPHHQQQQQQQDQKKMYLKQHIRQAVLQRVGSKSHMENVDEETEVKLAQEMKDSRQHDDADVVVIKDSKMDEQGIELDQQNNRETFISGQQRDPLLKIRHRTSPHRPLSRTQSSPLVTFSMPPQQTQDTAPVHYTFTTGLAYDTVMLKHNCSCGNNAAHPEHAGRLQSIWSRLQEKGLVSRCERVKSRKASLEELQSCHTENYTLLYGSNNFNRQKLDSKILDSLPVRFCILSCGGIGVDSDTVWSDMHTTTAARTATGCVIELAFKVAAGELKNGMAVVRPPGHHAEAQQAMGFCYFNSIAIAAKQLREKMKLEKVLILDWDVHHGNATQQMFYQDPSVLYISIHRHDDGNFFPGTGFPEECGADEGLGFNVNIAFGGGLNPPMGDAEYLTAFRTIIMPIAREFSPDIVLVSAGFDAAAGHRAPLGGYDVSPDCFGHMTREMMSLAGGKVVLVLEGGYDLHCICDASEKSVSALLGDELQPIPKNELCRKCCKPALETFENTIKIQANHWPCLKRYLSTIQYSLIEAQRREIEEADTVSALASLSMVTAKSGSTVISEHEQSAAEPMEQES